MDEHLRNELRRGVRRAPAALSKSVRSKVANTAFGAMAPASGLSESRALPHHLDLECSVLGLLLDGGQAAAMHLVRGHLEHPLHFYGRNNRILYQACLDPDDRGDRVDAEAVAALLHSTALMLRSIGFGSRTFCVCAMN